MLPSPNIPLTPEQLESLIRIQAYIRAANARREILVESLGEGIVHIRVRGNAEVFSRIGIELENRGTNPRMVDILSIDPKAFTSKAVGGDKLFNPVASTPEDRASLFGNAEKNVFINGGFFNASTSFPEFPEFTPIGPTKTAKNDEELKTIPVPEKYEENYTKITFEDGSYISTAPKLSERGTPQFGISEQSQEKFRYEQVREGIVKPKPGDLFHASDPNPRAGISFPGSSAEMEESAGQIRLVTALSTGRGPDSEGFTMQEFSSTMARLDRMNPVPGDSFNLDGGGSVALGITDNQGNMLFQSAQNAPEGRASSTMLVFSKK